MVWWEAPSFGGRPEALPRLKTTSDFVQEVYRTSKKGYKKLQP